MVKEVNKELVHLSMIKIIIYLMWYVKTYPERRQKINSVFTNKVPIFRYERLGFFCRNITEDGRGFLGEAEDFSV